MNCFIWILLLLGCGGNCGNRNNSCCVNTNWENNCNRCDCNRCDCDRRDCNHFDDICGNMNMIQPRNIEDCGCRHPHHDDDCMTPPPIPRRVMQEDDCDCNS